MSLADQQWCPTSVQVTVLQARGLRSKGKSGNNDAYAVMQVGKDKYQTSVAEKSVAPVWKEEAAFDLPPLLHQGGGGGGGGERGTLHVHVLHRALVGPDKQLGQAVIQLLQLSEDKTRNKTEWFKLLDKTGKADKDRGEVLLDIQFTRNNMTASMFDLSAAGKSRSRLGKFKDKVRGKKKESDLETVSGVVPSFSQVLTDSEEEGNGEVAPGKDEKKKKHKIKSLFSPKSNLQKNMSQSMSVLPGKNSSLSGSQSSGLNFDSVEGKKKFKFRIHKRSGSSDGKDSSSSLQKHGAAEHSNLCINGSHVYCEEPQPRTSRIGSNFSLASSGHGSMEDVPESSPPSIDSLRTVRQYSPWTEEEEEMAEEESKPEDVDEVRREEEQRMKMEEERKRREEEEERMRKQEVLEKLAEEKRRQEEEERIQREEERRKQKEEEERVKREEEIRLAEEKRRQEEEERKRIEEQERVRREEERRKQEEEERISKEEELERLAEERRRQEEEQERRRIEEERIRVEEEQAQEERKRQEEECRLAEEERIRVEEERAQEDRKRQEEEYRLAEEKRRLEEERRTEEEKFRQEEEERIRREDERAEEERRRQEEENTRKHEEEFKLAEENRRLEEKRIEEEKIRREEEEQEEKMRLEEQEKRQQDEEDRIRKEEERRQKEVERARKEKEEYERLVEEKRKLEEERERIEAEKKIRREEDERIRAEGERRKEQEAEEKRRQEEEKRQKEEDRIRKEEERRRIEEQEKRQKEEEEQIRKEEERRRIEEQEKRQKDEEERIRKEEERRIEEQEKRQKEEEERIRKEEERRREEEEKARKEKEEYERVAEEKRRLEQERRWKEDEEKIKKEEQKRMEVQRRQEEEERAKKEEMERLAEEEKKLEEQERRRQEEEERAKKEEIERLAEEKKKLEEEERRREEEEKAKREEMERLAEEKKKLEEQERKRIEEEEEKAERERKDEEARKLESKKLRDAEEQKKKENKTKVEHRDAGQKPTAVEEVPEEVTSTNPFDEPCSNNPFEIPDSPTGPEGSTAKVSNLQQGCQSAVSLMGNKAVSTDKDLISAQREKRPAPLPPGRTPSQREQEGSGRQLANIKKHGNDKDVKTVSVLPQRSMQSSTTKGPVSVAKNSKRPAPSRPRSVGEGPSSEPKTAPSSSGSVSQGSGSQMKQVPVVHSYNPFEDDDDENELTSQDDSTSPGSTGKIVWPPPLSKAADNDTVNQAKVRSAKIARAPPPPAGKSAISNTLSHQNTDGGHVRDNTGVAVSDNSAHQGAQAKISLSVQETTLKKSKPARVQSTGEEVKKEVLPNASRRLQPVKPLNPLEQQSASVAQVEKDIKSTRILCEVQEKTKVNDTGRKGPYSQLTREELISLVLKQENQLSERDKKISELEQYIDKILVRVIEEQPSILMSMSSLKKAA